MDGHMVVAGPHLEVAFPKRVVMRELGCSIARFDESYSSHHGNEFSYDAISVFRHTGISNLISVTSGRPQNLRAIFVFLCLSTQQDTRGLAGAVQTDSWARGIDPTETSKALLINKAQSLRNAVGQIG